MILEEILISSFCYVVCSIDLIVPCCVMLINARYEIAKHVEPMICSFAKKIDCLLTFNIYAVLHNVNINIVDIINTQ